MFPEPTTYRVTTEWAVQLAYLMGFKLDYSALHIVHAHNADRWLVSMWWKMDNRLGHMEVIERLPEIAVTLDQKVYDPWNEEITFLGYNEQENILVVGPTVAYTRESLVSYGYKIKSELEG